VALGNPLRAPDVGCTLKPQAIMQLHQCSDLPTLLSGRFVYLSLLQLLKHPCCLSDFEQWVRLGATGWSYKELLPYVSRKSPPRSSSYLAGQDTLKSRKVSRRILRTLELYLRTMDTRGLGRQGYQMNQGYVRDGLMMYRANFLLLPSTASQQGCH
jgi:hypothetical protein